MVHMKNTKTLPSKQSLPILTVSDKKSFAKNGDMIEMRETSKRLKLIINLPSINEAGLKASSRLLDVAEVIR